MSARCHPFLAKIRRADDSQSLDPRLSSEPRAAPLVLLLVAGGPADLGWARRAPEVNAILYCPLAGTASADALWRIVTRTGRKSSPAARLPFTWPASMDQVGVRSRSGARDLELPCVQLF